MSATSAFAVKAWRSGNEAYVGAAGTYGPMETRIGSVEHYYPKAQAAALALDAPLKVGDQIHIVGPRDDYWEEVVSLQVDHRPIPKARRGAHVGVWCPVKVHEGADVFKLDAIEA